MKRIIQLLWALLPLLVVAQTEPQWQVDCGKTVQVKAVPDEGFKFVRWSDGETANPRTVTAMSDLSFAAIYEQIDIPSSCPYSGTCGDHLTWELSCEGVLTVSGTGDMYDYSGWNQEAPWAPYNALINEVSIPNSVTNIGEAAFAGCTALTSVEAPAIFFDIPESAWSEYTKILQYVRVTTGELSENELLFINRSYKTLTSLDVSAVSNTEFADEAFKGSYNLESLQLPSSLQRVSYMMVAGSKNLKSIDIPASVEEIGQSAFEDCRSISTITFGGKQIAENSNLRKIGSWAFYNAHALQHLDIPAGVTEIGDGAFYGCAYMEDLSIPASVQTIGDNTFSLCTKIKKMVVDAVIPPTIQAKTFFEVDRQTPVYVPDESVDAYKGDVYWKEFNIQGRSNVPTDIEDTRVKADNALKILRGGQLYILRGEKVYTVQGQEVR